MLFQNSICLAFLSHEPHCLLNETFFFLQVTSPIVGMLAPPPPPPNLPGTTHPQVTMPTTSWMTPAVTQGI